MSELTFNLEDRRLSLKTHDRHTQKSQNKPLASGTYDVTVGLRNIKL